MSTDKEMPGSLMSSRDFACLTPVSIASVLRELTRETHDSETREDFAHIVRLLTSVVWASPTVYRSNINITEQQNKCQKKRPRN
jgi:hypothetical protein